MADQTHETLRRAQLASLLDRLPDLDLATYEDAPSPTVEPEADMELNNRWGFTFRRKAEDDPKPSIVIRPQGA